MEDREKQRMTLRLIAWVTQYIDHCTREDKWQKSKLARKVVSPLLNVFVSCY